jgi:ectoine hydroxylase-related dioxygenase (phytanoyl-CoA dioxygenase family)
MPKTYFETTDDDKLLETEKYYLDYHKGELRQNNPAENASLFEPLPDIEKNKAQFEIISWDMEAGDCILFHALTLHGAPGNCGDAPMRRFVTRWVNSKAVLSPHGETTKSMLLAHGFHVPFSAGEPVRGELFPLLPIERDRPKLAVEQF